jgi:hypothetical protein
MSYIFFLFFFLSHAITASHFHSKCLAALPGNQFINIKPFMHVNAQHIQSFKSFEHKGKPVLLGLHHDYHLNFAKQGLVNYRNIIKGVGGAFGADVFINNVNYGFKTLFPSHSTYDKIASMILALCIKRYERMTINQYCSFKVARDRFDARIQGILIRIIFDRTLFLVVTAYPLIEGHY